MTTDPKPADSASTNITEQPAPPPGPAPETTAITAAPPPAAPPAPTPTPTTPAVATPPTWPFKVDMAILAFLLILSCFLASFTATNTDLWLNFAIGKRISEGHFEFGVDPYSWATEASDGNPAVYWVHHSWLFSWLVFQLHNLAGGAGLIIGKAILFTATIALLCRIGWNETNRWFILLAAMMAALAISGRLFAQPMVLSYLFLAITMFVLARAGVFTLQHTASEPATPPPPADGQAAPQTAAAPDAKPEAKAPADLQCLWWLPGLFCLWANLDVWFILGPLVVALCWAAAGLARRFGGGSPVPAKTLGIVFAAGLAACVINPHHVRVFQLPPELAYVVLSVTDLAKVTLPDELVGAGRALQEFQKAEPSQRLTMSTLDSRFWLDTRVGMNVAGWAVFPLVLMGLAGFVLSGNIRAAGKGPTLHASRFLVWLIFAMLGLSMFRMIPFFAIVAVPLTAITLGEFLDWQQTINTVSAEKRDRGLALARLISLPVVLLLALLAWPGWLHGSSEANSARRVGWDVRLDSSLQRAAQTLQDLQEKGECGNVFNTAPDLGNVLPWFAPGVKHAFDSRLALFPGQMTFLMKVRQDLNDRDAPEAEWQTLFKQHGVRQAALVNLFEDGRILKWWFDADHWLQRYADRRFFVYSWSGANKTWPANRLLDDWNRLAFGAVPLDKRPPATGAKPPQVQSFWVQYLEGTGPQPAGGSETQALQVYLSVARDVQARLGQMTFTPPKAPGPLPTAGFVMFNASLVALQAAPGSATTIPHAFATTLHEWTRFGQRDFGPPAIPILMIRSARQAVAENPNDVASQQALLEAGEVLRMQQEEYWINLQRRPGSAHPSELRDRLRQAQLMAAAFHVAQLKPDNPANHERMALLYLQENCIDLALDHFEETYRGIEKLLATNPNAPKDPKERAAQLKHFKETRVDPIARRVRERTAKFKEMSEKDKPLERAAKAFGGTYHELIDGRLEEVRFGLVKKAQELLDAIDPKTLATKEEAQAYEFLLLELGIITGHAGEVAALVNRPEIHQSLNASFYARHQLLAGGALGNYELVEEALVSLEDQKREHIKAIGPQINFLRAASLADYFILPTMHSNQVNFAAALAPRRGLVDDLSSVLVNEKLLKGQLYNTIALRGIMALEAGETKHARTIFESVLKESADNPFFTDRAIAVRYLELLEVQKR